MQPMARILVVDDSPDQAASLARILQTTGHDVVTAPNGREALAQVISAMPDVVVLDLLMPEMDGPSFLEVVRSYLRLQSLPVVVFTGAGDSPLIDRIKALNVNCILAKGKASLDEVLGALEKAIAA